jgi:hypothetical protein
MRMTIHRVLASMFFAALLAVPTAAVHAGGMGIGTGGAYECYAASGASPGGTIELTDRFATRTVTLGGLHYVCAPVNGNNRIGPKNLTDPPAACDPNNPTAPCGDNLKCYDIRTQGAPATTNITLSDFFISGESVSLSRPQLLCVGAQAQ